MFNRLFRTATMCLFMVGLWTGGSLQPFVGSSASSNLSSQTNQAKKVQVFLAGDSTVQTYRDDVYPMQGWGQRIGQFFSPEVTFVNKAVGGRSSKSFIDEGLLDVIWDEIKPGDYLFIQFGHNDRKTDAKRHTDPYDNYKKYLRMYIDGAVKLHATPVLITPVARRSYDADGKLKNELLDYAAAMRQLAVERKVPLIDLNAKSLKYYESVGREGLKSIFLWLQPGEFPNYPDGIKDNDHFQKSGAFEIAKLVKEGIEESNLPIEAYLIPDRRTVAPNKN